MQEWQLIVQAVAGSTLNQFMCLIAVAEVVVLMQARKQINALMYELFEGRSLLERYLQEKTIGAETVQAQINKDFGRWEKMYAHATRWFYLFTTVIAVFPLMGIAGTVFGMLPGMKDFASMNASFGISLVSTFLGVVFSVLFKIAEGSIAGNYSLVAERINTLTHEVTVSLLDKQQKPQA